MMERKTFLTNHDAYIDNMREIAIITICENSIISRFHQYLYKTTKYCTLKHIGGQYLEK